MPRSEPEAPTLLRLAVDHLEKELYPTLAGSQRYRLRVAINALRIVERELTLGPQFEQQEREELAELCGSESASGEATLDALVHDIECGVHSVDDPRLTLFLRRNLERALRINNPRWIQATPLREGAGDGPQESS